MTDFYNNRLHVHKLRLRLNANASRPSVEVAAVARPWAAVMLVVSATATRLLLPIMPPARLAVMTCVVCGLPATPTSPCPSVPRACSARAAAAVARVLAPAATLSGAAMTALQAAALVLPLLARRRTRRLHPRSTLSGTRSLPHRF